MPLSWGGDTVEAVGYIPPVAKSENRKLECGCVINSNEKLILKLCNIHKRWKIK